MGITLVLSPILTFCQRDCPFVEWPVVLGDGIHAVAKGNRCGDLAIGRQNYYDIVTGEYLGCDSVTNDHFLFYSERFYGDSYEYWRRDRKTLVSIKKFSLGDEKVVSISTIEGNDEISYHYHYHSNGNMKRTCILRNNIIDGIDCEFDENGNITTWALYSYGSLIAKHEGDPRTRIIQSEN